MKKLMCLMMALLVAPAMATVTIRVVDNGDLTANIMIDATDPDADVNGSLVAGIGLDLRVNVGTIVAVTNFMATGESVADAKGYGIFMGTILFTGDPVDAIDLANPDYTPVAPADAPDNPGQLGTSACVLELGCLFNVNTPEAAPLATTILCTVQVSEEATLTLGENATRGGVVLIGGGAPSAMDPSTWYGLVTGPTGDCYAGQPDYDEWVAVGKPDSWCNRYQCRGDADGLEELLMHVPVPPPGYDVFTHVFTLDLGLFLDAYRVVLGGAGEDLACDFDHSQELLMHVPVPPPGYDVFTRVYSADLAIFLDGYRVVSGGLTPCGNPVLP